MVFVVTSNCFVLLHYHRVAVPPCPVPTASGGEWQSQFAGDLCLWHKSLASFLALNDQSFKIMIYFRYLIKSMFFAWCWRGPTQVSTPLRTSQATIASMNKEEKPSVKNLLRSPSDYFPLIRRGQSERQEKEKEVVSTGWNVEVTSRKEREEALR